MLDSMLVYAVGQQSFSWQKPVEGTCRMLSCCLLPKCMICKDSGQWPILPWILPLIYKPRFPSSQGGGKKKTTFKGLWAKLSFPLTPVRRRVILLNAGEEISSRALSMHTESKRLFGVG